MRFPPVQILSFSCSFWGNLPKPYVITHSRPLPEGWLPHFGEVLDHPLLTKVHSISQWRSLCKKEMAATPSQFIILQAFNALKETILGYSYREGKMVNVRFAYSNHQNKDSCFCLVSGMTSQVLKSFRTDKSKDSTVVDPGFPRGGAPIFDFAKFSQKLHEIERIWTPGGSKILLCRSATAFCLCDFSI